MKTLHFPIPIFLNILQNSHILHPTASLFKAFKLSDNFLGNKKYVYVLGNVVGIRANTEGVLVLGYEDNIQYIDKLKEGDNILYINDEKVKCYLATQAEPHVINTGLGFGATKEHQIISAMLNEYEDIVFDINKRNEFICPKLNTNPFEKLGYRYSENIVMIDDIAIYPAEYFDPINSNGYNVTEKTISIHHYSASWENGTHRLKRKIAYILGPNIEGKIKALKGR